MVKWPIFHAKVAIICQWLGSTLSLCPNGPFPDRAAPPPGNIFQAILNLRLLLGIIAKARNEVGLKKIWPDPLNKTCMNAICSRQKLGNSSRAFWLPEFNEQLWIIELQVSKEPTLRSNSASFRPKRHGFEGPNPWLVAAWSQHLSDWRFPV